MLAQSPDTAIIDSMLIGDIQAGNFWKPMQPLVPAFWDPCELPIRALGFRQRAVATIQRNHSRQSRELDDAVWKKSLEDVSKGFATGPPLWRERGHRVVGRTSVNTTSGAEGNRGARSR